LKSKPSVPRRRSKATPPPPAAPPATSERITTAEQAIRDRVCSAKLRPRLTRVHKDWNEIVSSLDAIGDTECAVSAYLNRYPPEADSGSRYLFAYGVLQALFIQQDAVVHLSAALDSRHVEAILGDKRIARAREVRNQAIGHPTRRDRPKGTPATTHQISRMSLGQGGFDMLTADADGHTHFESVNVMKLASEQHEAVAEILEELDKKLDQQDRETRKRFEHERLVTLFPHWLGYTFQTLHEATYRDRSFGPVSLDAVKDVLKNFTEALDRRGLGVVAYPGVKDWFTEIQHPLQELETFFDSTSSGTLHPKTAGIVVTHLRQKLAALKSMAAEIDEDWRVETS
jgi:hypothetical protein